MRTALVGGVLATLSLTTMAATGAFADGNGAQRSGLSPTSGTMTENCLPGTGAGTNGFAIVNAPGQPGNARFVNGEVSLKNAEPNTVYLVTLSEDGGECLPEGMITTNGQGNGNFHLNDATLSNGTFYVVLTDSSGKEKFASAPVTVN